MPPVVRFFTRNAATPTGSPAGTLTVIRRVHLMASTVATAVARALTVAPLEGMKETSFFEATRSNPVPTMLIVARVEAPVGVTDVNDPVSALGAAPTARAIRSVQSCTRDRENVSALVEPFLNRYTEQNSSVSQPVATGPSTRGCLSAAQSRPVPASTGRDPGKRLPVNCSVREARKERACRSQRSCRPQTPGWRTPLN